MLDHVYFVHPSNQYIGWPIDQHLTDVSVDMLT